MNKSCSKENMKLKISLISCIILLFLSTITASTSTSGQQRLNDRRYPKHTKKSILMSNENNIVAATKTANVEQERKTSIYNDNINNIWKQQTQLSQQKDLRKKPHRAVLLSDPKTVVMKMNDTIISQPRVTRKYKAIVNDDYNNKNIKSEAEQVLLPVSVLKRNNNEKWKKQIDNSKNQQTHQKINSNNNKNLDGTKKSFTSAITKVQQPRINNINTQQQQQIINIPKFQNSTRATSDSGLFLANWILSFAKWKQQHPKPKYHKTDYIETNIINKGETTHNCLPVGECHLCNKTLQLKQEQESYDVPACSDTGRVREYLCIVTKDVIKGIINPGKNIIHRPCQERSQMEEEHLFLQLELLCLLFGMLSIVTARHYKYSSKTSSFDKLQYNDSNSGSSSSLMSSFSSFIFQQQRPCVDDSTDDVSLELFPLYDCCTMLKEMSTNEKLKTKDENDDDDMDNESRNCIYENLPIYVQ